MAPRAESAQPAAAQPKDAGTESAGGARGRFVVWASLLAAALQLARFQNPEHAIDDSWVSFRVARNWIEAGVPTFDLSRPPVEGMTNLLWTVLSMAWIRPFPDVDPIIPARVLGGLLYLLTVGLLVRLAARVAREAGGNPPSAAVATGLALGASGWVAFHAMSGMETALYGALFALALDRLFTLWVDGKPAVAWVAGGALGLAAVTRPEGALIAACGCLLVLLEKRFRPHWLRVALPVVVLIVATEVFRWRTYHSLLPNTFGAKPVDPATGLRYFWNFLLYGAGLLGVAGTVVAAHRSVFFRWVAGLAAVVAVATVVSGGDWMPGFRRHLPAALTLALGCGVGTAIATGRTRWLALAGVACWMIGNLALTLRGRDSGLYGTTGMAKLGSMAQASPGVGRVALSDIGAFGWFFRGSIVDLYGLTDAHLASLPGTHGNKAFDEAYLRAAAPEVIVIRSHTAISNPLQQELLVAPNEVSLARWLIDAPEYAYRATFPLGGGWHLLVFGRRGFTLPDSIWGSSPPKSPAQLLAERQARQEGEAQNVAPATRTEPLVPLRGQADP